MLVLDWRCGEKRTGGDAGYKAGSPCIGAHVVHLWDRSARFFYGYRVGIGRTGVFFDYDTTTEYQTIGAALLAAENAMRVYGPLKR